MKRGMAIAVLVAVISPVGVAAAPAEESVAGGAAHVQSGGDPLFDDDFGEEENAVYDPLEETNRDVLNGNRFFDRYLFDPLTTAYSKGVPSALRLGIRNVFSNIDSPKVIANDLLQLEWTDAIVTTTRVVVNSTVGLGGLFDIGERMGLAKHRSDFGQTLALAGTPRGAYLVLPLFGPNTVRDLVGNGVDIAISPTTYLLGPIVFLYYGGGMGIVKREENYQALNALEDSSIDFYSTLRSAYQQQRSDDVWGRRRHRLEDAGEAATEVPR